MKLNKLERDNLINYIEEQSLLTKDKEKKLVISIIPKAISTDIKIGIQLESGDIFNNKSIIDWDNYDY
jgi:hypothetical protein